MRSLQPLEIHFQLAWILQWCSTKATWTSLWRVFTNEVIFWDAESRTYTYLSCSAIHSTAFSGLLCRAEEIFFRTSCVSYLYSTYAKVSIPKLKNKSNDPLLLTPTKASFSLLICLVSTERRPCETRMEPKSMKSNYKLQHHCLMSCIAGLPSLPVS